MFKRLFLIGILSLAPLSLFAKKEALIVAVGQYKNSKKMLHVGHDISKMEYLLEQRGFEVTVLRDAQATYRNVVKHLKSYQDLSRNDVFVFYDTSHGVQIPDLNDDEADGLDEAFALYDATFDNESIADVKGILVDDELELLLGKISAKKLMIIDACHSGSFHKGLSTGYTTKGLHRSQSFHNSKKSFFSKRYNQKVENLVVLSASKDSQLSIDTPKNGGLFTDTLYKILDKNSNINFKDLTSKSVEIIKQKKFNNLKPQEPQLHSTNNHENIEIDVYLQEKETKSGGNVEDYLDRIIQKSQGNRISIHSIKQHYRVGSSIYFDINTFRKKGYLYILNVGANKIERIFPNRFFTSSRIVSTRFRFPSKGFDIEADISNNKRQERTVAYVILSDKPIVQLEQNSKLSFERLKRVFRNSNLSVGKSDFWVFR